MGWKYEAGQQFNCMTLVSKVEGSCGHWMCQCDCGTVKLIKQVNDVRRGKVQTCGCGYGGIWMAQGRTASAPGENHGMSNTPLYRAWIRMKSTAHAAGAGMAERWVAFSGFHEDMGGSYKPNHSLRRTDSAKPFSASNCTWFYKGKRFLAVAQVRSIRRRLDESNKVLAEELGVSTSIINSVRAGKSYRDVR